LSESANLGRGESAPSFEPAAGLAASLVEVAGVGPKRLAVLQERGLSTFLDALYHLPRRYEDLRRRDRIADLRPGVMAIIEGTLDKLQTRPMREMRWRRWDRKARKVVPGLQGRRMATTAPLRHGRSARSCLRTAAIRLNRRVVHA